MANFKLNVTGLDKVIAIMNDLPRKTQSEIQDEMQATAKDWEQAAKRDAPADRGRLRGSVSGSSASLTLEMSEQVAYAAYQEFGTGAKFKAPAVIADYASEFKGGGDNGGVNVIDALIAWVKRHGLNRPVYNIKTRKKVHKNTTIAARSIAFAIFKKHQKEGMEPHSSLFTGRDGSDRITFFIDRLRKNIAERLKNIVG